MNHDTDSGGQIDARLARWLDGPASDEEERALDAAAAADPALAAELAAHRAVRARLATLARELEPERDLWPGVAERIGRPIGSAPQSTAAPSRGGRAGARLALAASLLAALAAGWALRSGLRPAPVVVEVPVETTAPLASVARTAYAATGRELDAIRDELRTAIESRREALPPATRQLVFDNLATIERAIAEIEDALASAPADADLARTYIVYRQRQIDLLRQANRLAARL